MKLCPEMLGKYIRRRGQDGSPVKVEWCRGRHFLLSLPDDTDASLIDPWLVVSEDGYDDWQFDEPNKKPSFRIGEMLGAQSGSRVSDLLDDWRINAIVEYLDEEWEKNHK